MIGLLTLLGCSSVIVAAAYKTADSKASSIRAGILSVDYPRSVRTWRVDGVLTLMAWIDNESTSPIVVHHVPRAFERARSDQRIGDCRRARLSVRARLRAGASRRRRRVPSRAGSRASVHQRPRPDAQRLLRGANPRPQLRNRAPSDQRPPRIDLASRSAASTRISAFGVTLDPLETSSLSLAICSPRLVGGSTEKCPHPLIHGQMHRRR